MKKSILTFALFYICNFSLFAQQKSWINEKLNCKKNTACFKAEGIGDSLEKAQLKAEIDITFQVLKHLGVRISVSEKDSIEIILKDGVLNKTETRKKIASITGEAEIKNLRRVDDFNNYSKKGQDGKYHQWYLYELSELHVGGLAFVPIYAQFKRKQYGRVIGLIAIETGAIVAGAVFANNAITYRSQSSLYDTNPVRYKEFQEMERKAWTGSILSYVGGTGLFYLLSTWDGLSQNSKTKRISLNKTIKFSPYYASSHSGIKLSINLN